jgi:manganese transport protein
LKENSTHHKAPQIIFGRLKFIGPSAIVTGSVVGSGSIVMTPLLGAAAGFTLMWWLLLSIWTKPIIQADISRYIVVTKKTFFNKFLNNKIMAKKEKVP